ncbi:putative serine/threonine-protein kinase [Bodo saltans virus]|uniref:Serine/threonine-protein kinase n=1 Tax=Bodo saltans virus TaxID=2024608 RepID=A0A2H4UTG4_9VIRU|nr:putative serine/threonine-protein kinase [Bodo saltans virus]ATZ80230.1 putative serine/threonine-protein kinase [Bodo saltans virus]
MKNYKNILNIPQKMYELKVPDIQNVPEIAHYKLTINEQDYILSDSNMIGKGAYGKVYYIGMFEGVKSVIKIERKYYNPSDHDNDIDLEEHFYKKYENYKSDKTDTNPLPKMIKIGVAEDKIKEKYVKYIILEYVGFLSLYRLFTLLYNPTKEEILLVKIIYDCIHKHLNSLHSRNIINRDMTPTNIILSDDVSLIFATNNHAINNIMSHNIVDTQKNITHTDIISYYKNNEYHKIVRFVDTGLYCDLDKLFSMQIYDDENKYCRGAFDDFNSLNGLFASSIRYLSPFSLFHFPQNFCNDIILKQMVKTLLILSDYWQLNLAFIIHMHNIMEKQNYCLLIVGKTRARPRMCYKDISDNIIISLPFISHNKIMLNWHLAKYIDTKNMIEQYDKLHIQISKSTQLIIDLTQYFIVNSIKHHNYDYELKISENEDIKKAYNDNCSITLETIEKMHDEYQSFLSEIIV